MHRTIRFTTGLVMAVVACAIALLAAGILAGTAGVAMAATGAAVGKVTEGSTPSEHKVRDVSDALSVLEPSRFPFDTMLRRLKGRRKKAQAIKVEFAATDRIPRTDAVGAGGSSAGSSGSQVVIPVANADIWRTDDLINLPNNLSAPVLLVEDVDTGANTVTVRALAESGFGTVPALSADDVLSRIGNSKTESFEASDSRSMMPEYDNNLIHTFDAVVEVSDHRRRTANHTSTDDWKRARQDNLYDLRKSFEYNYFFGTKSTTTGQGGKPRWTMNGVTRYIPSQIDYSIGGLTESQLIDINAQIFTGNNGAFTRMMFADSVLASDLDKVLLAKMQHAPTRKIAGVEFTELRTRFGRLLVAYHPGFDELGYRSFGVVLDMNSVAKRELAPMEKRKLLRKEIGIDDEAEQYTEKSTVELIKPDTHFIISGS